MKRGALDYLVKPFRRGRGARRWSRRRVRTRALEREVRALRREVAAARAVPGDRLVGTQPRDARDLQDHRQGGRAATCAVLITGESGTGKELVARAIHAGERARRGALRRASTARRSRASCSRASSSATSAAPSPAPSRRAPGRFREARRRHALPRRDRRHAARAAGQAAARAAERRGDAGRRRARPSRSTCASSPPPTATSTPTCATGRFREDLLYRLSVVPIEHAAAARAARGHPAARRALRRALRGGARHAARAGSPTPTLEQLCSVRLARQRARARERDQARAGAVAAARCWRPTTSRSCAAPAPAGARSGDPRRARARARSTAVLAARDARDLYRRILERVERPLLEAVLAHTGGNQLRAAALLGINRNTLRKKIAELGHRAAGARVEQPRRLRQCAAARALRARRRRSALAARSRSRRRARRCAGGRGRGAAARQARDATREALAWARAIRALTTRAGALFFVNDRFDLALAAGADGVHLGQDDLPPARVPAERARAAARRPLDAHARAGARRARRAGRLRRVRAGLRHHVEAVGLRRARARALARGGAHRGAAAARRDRRASTPRAPATRARGRRRGRRVISAVAGASDPEAAARALVAASSRGRARVSDVGLRARLGRSGSSR